MTQITSRHKSRHQKHGKIYHKVWQYCLFIVGLLLIFYSALLSLMHFATPYLQARNQQITAKINTVLPYPITIGAIKATRYYFHPILKLHDVNIFDVKKTVLLWHVDDLNIGINLWDSLLHWRFELGAITIKGLTVTVRTNADGSIKVGETIIVPNTILNENESSRAQVNKPEQLRTNTMQPCLESRSNEKPQCDEHKQQQLVGNTASFLPQLEKILMLRRIALEDVTLIWNRPNFAPLVLSKISLKSSNNLLRHEIIAEGQVVQQGTYKIAPFSIEVNFHDKWWRLGIAKTKILVKTENLNLHLPPELLAFMSSSSLKGSNNNEILGKFLPQRGEIVFLLHNTSFQAEQWFAVPVNVHYLGAHIGWQKLADSLRIQLSDMQLNLPTLEVQGGGALSWAEKSYPSNKPDADLQFSFTGTQPNELINYFPTKIMHQNLVVWLQHAFTAAGNIDGAFTLHGNLARFPFVDKNEHFDAHAPSSEIFKVEIALDNIGLLCNSDWPLLRDIQGRALFVGKSMEINAKSVRTVNVPLHGVKAVIADLLHPTLLVTGQTRAPANLMQEYVTSSPLRNTLGKYLTRLAVEGQIGLGLKITVPLYHGHSTATTAEGNIRLQDNSLLIPWLNLHLENINGEMQFFNEEITAPNLTAQLLNQPVTAHIATVTDAPKKRGHNKKNGLTHPSIGQATVITFTNTLPLSALQQQFSLPSFAPYAQGNFAYQGVLRLPHEKSATKETTLNLASDLRGIKINFPPLLTKALSVPTPFNLHFSFTDEFSKARVLMQCGAKISAILALAKDKGKEHISFSSGLLRFGIDGAPITELPATLGLTVVGSIDKVNWEEWRGYFLGTPSPSSKVKLTKETASASLLSIISNIRLHIGEFRGFGQIFAPLHINAESYLQDSHSNKHAWLVNLRNSVINGRLIIPHDIAHETLLVNLQKLYLPAAKDDAKQEKSTLNPHDLPPLNVVINDLRYGNKILGHFELETTPANNGLDIGKLAINAASFNLAATGMWQKSGDFVQSTIQGKCTTNNAGAALKQLEFTESLDRGTGEINFVLSWPDAFFAPTTSLMDGSLSFALHKGRIIHLEGKTEAEIGIGRLLNIISLQSLPRRLALDFSDLVKSGFSFDTFRGDFKLTAGNAVTDDTELAGAVAQVKMKGRIGFGKKDYDMDLTVLPHLTSSIPMVAAVAGGPVLGAAAWVADKIIGGQVSRVVSHVYKIKGSWLKPDIQKTN